MEAATLPTDFTTFHTLPIELKRDILILAQADSLDAQMSRRSTGVRLTFAHVCLEWRKIAFEDLKLFQAVLVDTPSDARALLALVESDGGESKDGLEALQARFEEVSINNETEQSPQRPFPVGSGLADVIKRLHIGTLRPWPLEIHANPRAAAYTMDLRVVVGPFPFLEELEISGFVDDALEDWIEYQPHLRRLTFRSCKLRVSTEEAFHSPKLEHLQITDTLFFEPMHKWLQASGLPKLKSSAFVRNAELQRLRNWEGKFELSMRPVDTHELDHKLFLDLDHLSFWDGEPSYMNLPLELESFEGPESFFPQPSVLDQLSFLRSLTIRRNGLKAMGSMQHPLAHVDDEALQYLVENAWPSGLEQIIVPWTWPTKADYKSLASRCDGDVIELNAEKDPEMARERRLFEIWKKAHES